MLDNTIGTMNTIDYSQIFNWQNAIIYLVIINLITFLAMYIDKKKAKYGKWRISESALFILVLLGGGFGGIASMYVFRHKTQKPRFVIGFPAILIFEIFVVVYYTFFAFK